MKKHHTEKNIPSETKEGIILVDKPKGITSFDVIRKLRQKLGVYKMGHAGTLDPLATGLMIVALGSSTKKLTEYLKLPKTYEAEILLGTSTDSGDITGKVLRDQSVEVTLLEAQNAIQGLRGTLKLPVPMYSAIKVQGVRLYTKARKGEVFETPIKEMEVHKADLNEYYKENGKVVLHVVFDVGSGTYIRSLAEEVGRRLNVPATIQVLRRTRIGDFSLEQEHITL